MKQVPGKHNMQKRQTQIYKIKKGKKHNYLNFPKLIILKMSFKNLEDFSRKITNVES